MPRGHPLRQRFGELAALYEEVAATRAELSVASSRLAQLSPKSPRAASPSRPAPSLARRPGTAGAASPSLRSPGGPRRGGPPPRGGASPAAVPLHDQGVARWEEYLREFERKREVGLLAAERAAAEAAAESEEE